MRARLALAVLGLCTISACAKLLGFEQGKAKRCASPQASLEYSPQSGKVNVEAALADGYAMNASASFGEYLYVTAIQSKTDGGPSAEPRLLSTRLGCGSDLCNFEPSPLTQLAGANFVTAKESYVAVLDATSNQVLWAALSDDGRPDLSNAVTVAFDAPAAASIGAGTNTQGARKIRLLVAAGSGQLHAWDLDQTSDNDLGTIDPPVLLASFASTWLIAGKDEQGPLLRYEPIGQEGEKISIHLEAEAISLAAADETFIAVLEADAIETFSPTGVRLGRNPLDVVSPVKIAVGNFDAAPGTDALILDAAGQLYLLAGCGEGHFSKTLLTVDAGNQAPAGGNAFELNSLKRGTDTNDFGAVIGSTNIGLMFVTAGQ